MRNLKKVLAMVLALVMSMSLLTVANAADFSDKGEISYKEAVDVMESIGVIDGMEDGSFNPTGVLTREQAAKLICTMLLGSGADKLGTTKSSFTDVLATRWSSPYIEYCNSLGIIAGNGDGTYNPTGKLTGHAFAKMLLVALGYDAAREGYTGSTWAIEVAKDAISAGIDVDGVAMSAEVTREVAAQMAFQTLEATMVEYATAGSTVITPDGTQVITGGSTASKVENNVTDVKKTYNNDADKFTQFCEEYFSDLKKRPGSDDDLGRPGSKWVNDSKTIGTYGDEADYVVTMDEVTAKANIPAKLRDLTDNKDLTNIKNAEVRINGKTKSYESDLTELKTGAVVELFCDGDKVERLVVLNYSVNPIDDVSTSLTKAQKEDGATCKIKVDGKFYLDIDVAGFNASTYEEDAYLLYIAEGSEILDSYVAESVEGKVTAKRGDEVRIGGEYYTVASGSASVGDEGTFYLNKAGQIVAVDTTATKSGNYIYIYKMDKDTGLNSDGIEATTWTAYGVLADGTKVSYEVKAKDGKFDGSEVTLSEDYTGVIAYSINSDDQLVYKTAKDTIEKKNSLTINEDKAAGTSSKTDFIFAYKDGSKVKTNVATGYKNVDVTSAAAWTVTNEDDDILYVFVAAKNGTVTTDANLAVVLDSSAIEEENADGDPVYTYVVAVDGEETELTFETEQIFQDGAVIAYEMDGDYAVIDEDADVTTGKLSAANDDYFTIEEDSKQYNFTGEETIYTITVEYKNNNAHKNDKVDNVTVTEGGKIEKNDDKHNKVVFTQYKGDLDVVFFYECVY